LFATKKEAKQWEVEKLVELEEQEHAPSAIRTPSLLEFATEYLNFSKTKHGRKTYEEKQRTFRSFFKSVDSSLEVTALHKRDVLAHLSKEAGKRSGYAANKERKNLVVAWNWACQYIPGFPSANPMLAERFPEERSPRYIPSEDDFWKVYKVAESEQDRIMLLCYLHLAARRNEIFSLRVEDVNLSEKKVRLYTKKRKDGSLCYDWVPISPTLFKELSGFSPAVSGEWIFSDPRSGLPYVYRQKWVPRLCRFAGVDKFSIHAIRHLSDSILIKNNVSLLDIQTILRHHKITTTERYIHRLENVRSAVEVF
jgi:integrase